MFFQFYLNMDNCISQAIYNYLSTPFIFSDYCNIPEPEDNGIYSNSGFLSNEFLGNTGENNTVSQFDDVKWGIDTVRLKFYFKSDADLENYVTCLYKKIEGFNIVKLKIEVIYIYYNLFGQKFLYNPVDKSAFLEFSLPKFLKYQNTAYCNEYDLFRYCNEYLSLYCHNGYILLNRIDFSVQYSFSSEQELQGFDKFLRSCQIKRKSSSQDYCFWKFEERTIRFYGKKADIERKGNKSHPNEGKKYDEWLKTLQWAEANNIGRLEYQYRMEYIKKISKDRQVFKVDYDKLRFLVTEQAKKDFPYNNFDFETETPFYEIVQKIKKAFQRPDSYLECLLYASRYGLDKAKKLMSRQVYSNLKCQLKKKLGITFEQILTAGYTVISFPSVSMWEEKEINFNQYEQFQNMLCNNALALEEQGFNEEEILKECMSE